VDILSNKLNPKTPYAHFFTQTIKRGEGFESEMHFSMSKALLGLSLAAAATVRNLDAASN
jgi:hypothetical protein